VFAPQKLTKWRVQPWRGEDTKRHGYGVMRARYRNINRKREKYANVW